MESIIRNVTDIESDKREWLESAIGQKLQDNQKVIIRVLTPGIMPDDNVRSQAAADVLRLCEEGTRNREAQGISVEEADEIVDEAIREVRRTKPA